ncbi:MAG: sigma 54-interacting transcriptional regulator [Polyangiaceae bacterium]|nr:sigma 54-interacting transcriptional regulator [Polyangiaceae bacterium]
MDAPTELHADVKAERHVPRLFLDTKTGAVELELEPPVVVGSAQGATLRIDLPTVSRVHAELSLRTDGLWVRDLESTNGTFVQGVRIREARLDDGAVLRLGTATIRVRYAPPAIDALWPDSHYRGLIGRSNVMRRMFRRLARASASEATVLVQGETGTGKELVARAIHDESARRDGPFVVVDCAALTESLVESELFGHLRGSFTGASDTRAGAIELAHGGTVFLDEIAELPLSMQPKLLRVLESRTVRRIGARDHTPIDVRFVAATHRDLAQMAAAGTFREDLYFRLAVLPIQVPSLRERLEDLELLASHFTCGAAVDPVLLEEARRRAWPGNVRELRNFLERANALGNDDVVSHASTTSPDSQPSDAVPFVALDVPFKQLAARWNDELERRYLRGLLDRHGGNVSAVARAAELDRSYVHRLMRKHGLTS